MDRNIVKSISYLGCFRSLSARRAWIEMLLPMYRLKFGIVALRKESVDRNYAKETPPHITQVALRKESVDRNSLGARVP